MIFASSMTWRSTISCVAFRYSSTARSSTGEALTSTTPEARVDDHVAAFDIADDGRQRGAQVFPEIIVRRGLDAGAVDRARAGVAARTAGRGARLLPGSAAAVRGRAGHGRRTAGDPDVAHPLPAIGQVVDLENPRLDGIRLHGDALALHPVVVAIDIAQRIERLAHRCVLQVQADRAGQFGGNSMLYDVPETSALSTWVTGALLTARLKRGSGLAGAGASICSGGTMAWPTTSP
jgi:hypothetical protein